MMITAFLGISNLYVLYPYFLAKKAEAFLFFCCFLLYLMVLFFVFWLFFGCFWLVLVVFGWFWLFLLVQAPLRCLPRPIPLQ